MTTYGKPATDVYAIFQGDVLYKVAGAVAMPERPDLNCDCVQSGYETGTPGTTPIQGVSANYGKAATLTYHGVYDEPDMIFLVQSKTGTTYSTSGYVGKNAMSDHTTAGSTTTGQSGMMITTIATTAASDWRTRKISTIAPNVEGACAIFEVVCILHSLAQGVAGV